MAEMKFDVTTVKNPFSLPGLHDIPCFRDYHDDPEEAIDLYEVVRYVLLLYSKDGPLSKRPIKPLTERRIIAAKMAGLNPEDERVINLLFNLSSERIRDLIIFYLIEQNQIPWMERCILEQQLLEAQRLRFKPIQNKALKTRKKRKSEDEDEEEEDREDDDKYLVETSTKKSALTDHSQKYYDLILKYDSIIFQDNDNVKDMVKRKHRVTLESLAS